MYLMFTFRALKPGTIGSYTSNVNEFKYLGCLAILNKKLLANILNKVTQSLLHKTVVRPGLCFKTDIDPQPSDVRPAVVGTGNQASSDSSERDIFAELDISGFLRRRFPETACTRRNGRPRLRWKYGVPVVKEHEYRCSELESYWFRS